MQRALAHAPVQLVGSALARGEDTVAARARLSQVLLVWRLGALLAERDLDPFLRLVGVGLGLGLGDLRLLVDGLGLSLGLLHGCTGILHGRRGRRLLGRLRLFLGLGHGGDGIVNRRIRALHDRLGCSDAGPTQKLR
eukprot:Transcript_24789.p2 GENE.Transcript_24789~~Transcript_24789.p2  ORF type:complete len:137 (-),score=21.99 Transcript_24789:196-606(-)